LDVAGRLALAATVDRGWHRTAAFGIRRHRRCRQAAAAERRADGQRLGIAYSQAAGVDNDLDGALTKRFQAASSQRRRSFGFTVPGGLYRAHQVFAGRFGFFPMYQPDGYDLDAITDGLGENFRGVELSFKPYPPDDPTMPFSMWPWRSRNDSTWRPLMQGPDRRVVITVNPQTYKDQLSPEAGKRRPSQVVEAQFSIPFLVAAALVRGRVGIGEVAGVDDQQVLALSDRIQGAIRADAAPTWAQITVRRADGRTASLETTSPSGSRKNPSATPPGGGPRLRRPCGAAYRRGRRAPAGSSAAGGSTEVTFGRLFATTSLIR
jgi:hypothetical protein